ncbi:DUF3114 domain-containing protein [Streptococcus uberis]|uniref:DUF3114 domain-containing protein n=1 Tax=Streptococcus uberis TaxID=1349 RepID=UPI0018E137FC|nr:DUF3114 domain-containing protein [Streptococcus uberis]MBI0908066.1 DUF3114 domain-containing protein [Streptococcus uberis]MCK1219253.1 DUF3114 domain-containing protein [Streptococcus uberis]MCK1250512.1 DUF3114 domain-containing protein [Streptococcus uberis]
MVKVDTGTMASQVSSVTTVMANRAIGLQTAKSALSAFGSTDALTGSAYSSAKNYSTSVIIPLIDGMTLLSDSLEVSVTQCQTLYDEICDGESLDSDVLEAKIASDKQTLSLVRELKKHLKKQSATLSKAFDGVEDSLEVAIKSNQKKLDNLMRFDGESVSAFSDMKELNTAVKNGLGTVQSDISAFKSGTSLPVYTEDQLPWQKTIKEQKEIIYSKTVDAYVDIELKDMPKAEKEAIRKELKGDVKSLGDDGWTLRALNKGYLRQGKKQEATIKSLDDAQSHYKDAHIVGSETFTSMTKEAYKNSKEGQKATIVMLTTVLGGVVDKNNFLQLEKVKFNDKNQKANYTFTKDINQAIAFDNAFASIVQEAYPKGLPTSAKPGTADYNLAQKTHQFRYYLDKQNNDALRASYPKEKNDLERIKSYNKDEKAENHFKGEKARLHNKYQGSPENFKKTFPSVEDQNVKYVTSENGFHSEFIVDKNNHLVSQWNAYGEPDENGHFKSSPPKNGFTHDQESQIVNGNSVNFSEDADTLHSEYDSNPVKMYDSEIRANVEKWKSPVTGNRNRNLEDYFDVNKSEEGANRRINE